MTPKPISTYTIIKPLFFISGFAALIYQIAWQRMLFSAFGVDLQSVTIIIAVFMAGLGIGGFWGGRIADKVPQNLLLVFCAIELGIGIFGFLSVGLILWLKNLVLLADVWLIALANFALLFVPTFLMGATLPLLTSYLNQHNANTGENIGWLYFTNTLGAAVSCLAMAFVFFVYLSLYQTIYMAAAINCLVAVVVFALDRHQKHAKAHP